ncbi:MAG: nicotinate-nucleotide adenylyltransferase [Hyphomicrobiaceae bacterium]
MRKSAPFKFGSIRARPPHAEPRQRIGLLGGSFNPPHAAHRQISQIALKRLKLDRVWWIVTPGNPLKAHGELAPRSERIADCRAVARDARITVTGFEAELGSAFTAGTLMFVTQRYPHTRFVWIMGADGLPQFHRWGQWRDIFHTLPIAVIDRPGWHLPALSSKAAGAFARARVPAWRAARLADATPPAWTFLTGPLTRLSSTAIRR